MPKVVGIRFRRCGKVYDFEIDGIEVNQGDHVVVESSFGLSIGAVISGARYVEETDKELKKVIRLASEKDFKMKAENEALEIEAKQFCQERITSRVLPMKLVHTEVTLDRKRIVFYFTADGRIDFRDLVKDLASRFKTRIEMRQIGVRDETKFIGGMGICGREVCCRSFLSAFAPVSIKMAKRQDLVLNPGKLSGLCGRLMCCLGYEVDEGLTEDVVELTEDSPLLNTDEEYISIGRLSETALSKDKDEELEEPGEFFSVEDKIKEIRTLEEKAAREASLESSGTRREGAASPQPKQGEGRKHHHRKKFHKKPPESASSASNDLSTLSASIASQNARKAEDGVAKSAPTSASSASKPASPPVAAQAPKEPSTEGTPEEAEKKRWRHKKKYRGKKKT